MTWDLGLRGMVVLAAIAIGFGLLAGVLAGHGWKGRAWTAVVAAAACFVVGLLTSEVLFGWATEEDLQPNVDGLSRDEVLLSSLLTTVVVVAASRRLTRHGHVLRGRHST